MDITKAQRLIEYVIESGKRIAARAGSIEDIGVKKAYLTEEDINIERGIKNIIAEISGDSSFYAEEENDTFVDKENVWICDPISGTKLFIQGLPHYAIVVSHLTKGIVDFAVVYDPSFDNLYTADNTGAYLNGVKISHKNSNSNKVIFAPTSEGNMTQEVIDSMKLELDKEFEVQLSQASKAVNYCLVAMEEFAGLLGVAKDSFPEFAGCFIANMSGCIATNIDGQKNILPTDRKFVCGNNSKIYQSLLSKLQ